MLTMNIALALCDTNIAYILPTDDAHAQYNNPTANYNNVILLIDNNDYYKSYGVLKFDISSFHSENIISAYLQVVSDLNRNILTYYKVESDNWDETTYTYNNRVLLGDSIGFFTPNPIYSINRLDVTDYLIEKLNIDSEYITIGIYGGNVQLVSKDFPIGTDMEFVRPRLIVIYGDAIDISTLEVNSYTYEGITDVDLYNNYYYAAIQSVEINSNFIGSESNSAYNSISFDDVNFNSMVTINSQHYCIGNRFEMKIDEDPSTIRKIDVRIKSDLTKNDVTSYIDPYVYCDFDETWYRYNSDILGIGRNTSNFYLDYERDVTFSIVNNFDRYIDENGVFKTSLLFSKSFGHKYDFNIYYYEVKVYYYDHPVVVPEDPPGGDSGGSVYPNLNDDNPVISLDGQYSGDLQNVLFRNLFQLNDKIGIPTWSLILLVGLIGVWKRRPELVIFCGLLFLFLLFFGYKLEMTTV